MRRNRSPPRCCSPTTIENKRNGLYSTATTTKKIEISNNFSLSPFGFAHEFESLRAHSICSIFFLLTRLTNCLLFLLGNHNNCAEHYQDSRINNECWHLCCSGRATQHTKAVEHSITDDRFVWVSQIAYDFLFSVNTAKFVSRSISVGLH